MKNTFTHSGMHNSCIHESVLSFFSLPFQIEDDADLANADNSGELVYSLVVTGHL